MNVNKLQTPMTQDERKQASNPNDRMDVNKLQTPMRKGGRKQASNSNEERFLDVNKNKFCCNILFYSIVT